MESIKGEGFLGLLLVLVKRGRMLIYIKISLLKRFPFLINTIHGTYVFSRAGRNFKLQRGFG